MRNSALLFLCTFICLFFSKNSILGNNGSVAYIYPVSNISIDGNLNDWPADIQKIPLQNIHYGAGLSGPEDATAFWQGGYDPASGYLYIAALTIDDDYVKTPDNGHYSSHDFQVLYIDPAHLKKGSGVIAYEIDEDHRKIVNQEGLSFYPQLKNASFNDVELVIKRELNTTIYEWKIKVSGALTPGRVLGFDYAVFDKDTNEDNVMVTWGPTQGNKFMNSQLIGDLVLLATGDSLSNVSGTLEWKGEAGKKWPQAVVFNHQTNSDLFIAAGVDSLGNYSVKLPKGVYDISIPASWQMNKWFDIDLIKSGDHTTAIDVQNNKNIKVDAIAVARIPKPALIPEKGLLHESFTKESAQQTDAFIEAYRAYYNIPGVSLAIIQDGKLVYHQSYGVENTITQKPLRDKAVFEAASITKLVFAYVMNRLIQRGEFDIDKPLYETLPFPELEKYPEYKLMTARHVLTHKSGLPNWGTEMKNTPGTVYGYSGEGFEYLKKVLAKGEFDSLPQIIQSHLEAEVLHPFGMTNTYFMCNEQLPELKVAGHINGIPNTFDCPEGPGMAFSMHTEAKDFVPFALALLNREGLTPEQATNMFRYHTVEKEEDWYKGYKSGFGLGVALRESPHGLVFGHGGNNGDFRCVFEMYDDLKSGYIMFTNSNTGGPLLFDLKDFLVEGKE
ncbi:serine hydrolase [Flavobacteriaceae bacterium M23B6Z8]